jgi:hypothetical protein
MNIKFAYAVTTVISALYDGGITEFNKYGQITILPHPAKDIVVYHPALSDEIKKRLIELQDHPSNKGKNKVVFMDVCNFVSLSGDELRMNDVALVRFFNKIDPSGSILFENHSNLIVVTLPNIKDKDDESLPLIFGHLKNLEGLIYAYVITADRIFLIDPTEISDNSISTPKKITKMVPSKGDREITQDDITNLIIELENSKSIDDLIG